MHKDSQTARRLTRESMERLALEGKADRRHIRPVPTADQIAEHNRRMAELIRDAEAAAASRPTINYGC